MTNQIRSSTRTKVYQIEGMDDAIGEFETDEELRVLDDFHASGFLANYHAAIMANDAVAKDRMVAEHAVYVAERFGKGEVQSKADYMAARAGKKADFKVRAHTAEQTRLRAFGNNMVLKTGVSNSEIMIKGQPSHGPRLFAIQYMKLGGQWQCVVHTIMDFDGEYI